MKALITCRQMQNCFEEFAPRFEQAGIEVVMPEVVQQPTEDELIEIIGEFDGMIAGDDPLTERVLEHATKLKILSKWGIGTDGIDKVAAERLGIPVTNTPNMFGDEVADVGMAYVVMLARQLHRIHASVADGGWWKWEGRSLAGATMGVVGFGNIGQAQARRGLGHSMTVVAYDPWDGAVAIGREMGVDMLELDEVFSRSDFLVLCAPYTGDNHHLVNGERLALMPEGACLVNVARGPLVDEAALVEALSSGRLFAAALDVFEDEPLGDDHPLRRFPQCVFGSHNGSNTREGVLRASAKAVDNLFKGLGLA